MQHGTFCSANEIKLPGGEELGALLTTNNVLKEVDVSWNDITGEDGQLLLQGLALNKSVEVFRASWNRLGKAALPYLDDVLNRSKILYELDLRHCGMDQHHAFENSTHTTPRLETPLTFVQNPRVSLSHPAYLDCCALPPHHVACVLGTSARALTAVDPCSPCPWTRGMR